MSVEHPQCHNYFFSKKSKPSKSQINHTNQRNIKDEAKIYKRTLNWESYLVYQFQFRKRSTLHFATALKFPTETEYYQPV